MSTEWEVALLAAFSKLGTVQYEPKLGGTRTPDLFFSTADKNLAFAAEIATISDQALHQRNPVWVFLEEFGEKTLAANIRNGGFTIHVGSTYPMRGLFQRGVRIGLKLPPKDKFDELIFNHDFDRFIAEIEISPDVPHDFSVSDERNHIELRVGYRPDLKGVTTNFNSYTYPTRIDRNPLYNALKGKADQLKKTRFTGLRGVVICDGGCQLLHRISLTWNAYSTEEIIREFFRRHTSVTFVLIITVRRKTSLISLQAQGLVPEVVLHLRPGAEYLNSSFMQHIGNLSNYLPPFEGSPENVLNHMKFHKRGSFHGGYTMTDTSVRISATTLLQLLAGELSYKEFSNSHQFTRFNPFLKHLNRSEMLTAAEIIHTSDDDDDWIEFRFGPPDSATAPFRVPVKVNKDVGS